MVENKVVFRGLSAHHFLNPDILQWLFGELNGGTEEAA